MTGKVKEINWFKALCWELHISRIFFFHHNWKAFAYTPWLPDTIYWQWIYVVYRWIIFLFFFIYFIWNLADIGVIVLIYLTTWSLNLLTLYLFWSCMSVTVYYVRLVLPMEWAKRQPANPPTHCVLPSKPSSVCGYQTNTLRWYDVVHWILFIIGPGISLGSMILFWGTIYRGTGVTHWDVAIHLLNGVFSFLEVWVSRIPIRVYHAIYAILLACVYVGFSGIYFSAGGENRHGDSFIYSIIDYGNSPVEATVTVLLAIMLFAPVVVFFYYANYLLREAILRTLAHKRIFKWLCEEDRGKSEATEVVIST